MGVVVAAHHLGLDRPVAIKLMRPELRMRKEYVRRFVREARAAARLNSSHVARVFDVGVLDDGAPYIVMEYLDGIDLAGWLRQRGPVPVSLAAAIVVQACDAIAEAHAAGIIHRDLKPSNLLVVTSRDGEPLVKVLDLGICKLVSSADEPADTSTGPALGTPLYMAPEQLAAASRADARSDVWSLGAILYELVTGQVPFPGRTVAELQARVTCDPCPAIGRGVPVAFEAVVARCLAKDPAARFQRAADLAAGLASAAGSGAHVVVSPPHRGRRRLRRWALLAAVLAAQVASDAWPLARPEAGRPILATGSGETPPERASRSEPASGAVRGQGNDAPRVAPSSPAPVSELTAPRPLGPLQAPPPRPRRMQPRSAMPSPPEGAEPVAAAPSQAAEPVDPLATPY
jgi:serine/threonine-protein kinase